jgi:hypothetical protein
VEFLATKLHEEKKEKKKAAIYTSQWFNDRYMAPYKLAN